MKWSFRCKSFDPILLRLVEAINRKNGSKLVSIDSSCYTQTELPFYNSFKLYTLVDLSFTPYLQLQLLDNGNDTLILDGTQTPFTKANSISPIILTSKNVFNYARFVLSYIVKNDFTYKLIAAIDDVDFSSEPTNEEYSKLNSTILNPKIKKSKDSFLINTFSIFDDSVFEALIKVSHDGLVEILKEKKVLENMPVRELMVEL